MIATTVAELARMLGCPPPVAGDPDAVLTGVVVDSRLVGPGCLFVALPGERVDGHDYVQQAWRDGAAAAVTARPVAGGCALVVEDPLVALGQIGRSVVVRAKQRGLAVAAITGSQGKTSTKDLLAQILSRAGETVAPQGSFNNEIGVPLTAARIGPDTRYLISEMGARGRGHIAYLCELTPPDVGVVLNVGSAHLGMFGSQQAIARAKGELVEAVPPTGVAVLNLTDPLVAAMADRTSARLFGFAEPGRPVADVGRVELSVSAEDPRADLSGRWSFTLCFSAGPGGPADPGDSAGPGDPAGPADPAGRPGQDGGPVRIPVQLRLLGRHQIGNALAAAAAAAALGLAPAEIAAGLDRAELQSRWRMEVQQRADGLTVVNDAYNANPGSMAAALDTLAGLGQSRRANGTEVRTVAVLGDMLELGEASAREHAALGRQVAELGIDQLYVVGAEAASVIDGAVSAGYAKENASMFSSVRDLGAALIAAVSPWDVVLLKASRSVGLEVLAEPLTAEPGPNRTGS